MVLVLCDIVVRVQPDLERIVVVQVVASRF